MNEPRADLSIQLTNMVAKIVPQSQISDYKFQIDLILSAYEIEKRKKELSIITEGKNEIILKKFIAAKIAAGLSMRTINYYRLSVIAFFDKVQKDYDQITADDVRIYLAKRTNIDRISKTTANNERRNISAFYAWLQTEEILMKNPMKKVAPIKVRKEKKKAYTDMELEKVREVLRSSRERAMVELLISTWCRVTEVSQIKLSDINGNEILVHGKGDKDRIVYLNAKAQIAIEAYLKERHDINPYLFPRAKYAGCVQKMTKGKARARSCEWFKDAELVDDNEHIGQSTIESILREAGKRAGVENVHPHRFRRTGATSALRAGMPLITVSKLLGHSNIGTTQIYLDISDDELEEAHKKYVR